MFKRKNSSPPPEKKSPELGDAVWTYIRRATDEPRLVQGKIEGVFDMPSKLHPQYLVDVQGTMVIRDKLTCAHDQKDIKIFARDKETTTYHD